MNKQEFADSLKASLDQPFSGWDFSVLAGKMEESAPPWNYRLLVEQYAQAAQSMLDMGTGGGEFLASLPALPAQTFATEGYAPNIALAQSRLAQKGVQVREVLADNVLPFDDQIFDLVINRHEEYAVGQVWRVLRPGGLFLTQQVGGLNDSDINALLGKPAPAYFDWCLFKALDELITQGFKIIKSDQHNGLTRFYDAGSLVYYLKCIPWQIENFSIDACIDRLYLLHEHLCAHGHIDFINQRFFLLAQKPEGQHAG